MFLRTAWKECGAPARVLGRLIEVADEGDVHAIGLARDPVSKVVSAYKEILARMQRKIRSGPDTFKTDPWWHANATSAFPGIERTDTCLDWIWIGQPRDPRALGPGAMEDERFRGFLEALGCGCRYHDFQHVATSTWWMALRRTVTAPAAVSSYPSRLRTPTYGLLPPSFEAIARHEDVRRTGYATPHIDEVWNTVDLSAEVPRLIERFGIQQDADKIGAVYNGTCEQQSARTYFGTAEQKDTDAVGVKIYHSMQGPPAGELRALLAEESAARAVCDAFAQDYICFGLEPPRQCAALREAMERRGLVKFKEGYRGRPS